ncbi:PLP-dependent aminotransferase family protein [Rhodococcus erythropolis]|uniref:aminotransferase-like domain-containing protein n=1 Tax=Rhodococcus erythropolis TaxID=1833 RepID=UPI001E43E909|nr:MULTISPECIES: PLP-dependent aminotransferase family protein [Rhodococcus erythropolis group]MCD2109271.1 PLP-dependent aminotransferase family protein [Rhodococcus qingshengii]MCZ4528195.1 PLP-dependent aminotransferase family protein [Rhodococcus erythropolis]
MRFPVELLQRDLGGSAARRWRQTELAQELRRLIESGVLGDEVQLPSERTLAAQLGCSRGTVTNAYGLLREHGLLNAQQGSGTTVRRVGPPAPEPRWSSASVSVLPGRAIDLTVAAAEPLPELMNASIAAAVADGTWINNPGYAVRGLPELREEVVRWYVERGVPTRPEQILITSGAQQGLALTTALLAERGVRAAAEAPSYAGALALFRRARLRVSGISREPDRLDLDRLTWLAAAPQPPAFFYCATQWHNPLGGSLDLENAQKLAELTERYQLPVLCDDALVDTGPGSQPLLCALNSQVISVGSVSKLGWGGLRVGWVRASPQEISTLAARKAEADLATGAIDQRVAVEVMRQWEAIRGAQLLRLQGRLQALTSALEEYLPEWSYQVPAGGVALWITLPDRDSASLCRAAARHGVRLVPGLAYQVASGPDDHVRIPFTLPEGTLREAVQRLAIAWREADTELGATV